MEKPWKVVAAFLLVFVAGAVFGGVFVLGVAQRRQNNVVRAATPPPETGLPASASTPSGPSTPTVAPKPVVNPKKVNAVAIAGLPPGSLTPQIMRQFTQKLGLNGDQQRRIRPVIARTAEDLLRLRQENMADTARATERMYEDIEAVLTPPQRAELDKMRVEMQERVKAEQERVKAERLKRLEQAAGGEGAPVRPKAQAPKQGAQ